tara:strand:+ start:89 stop:619 length:531 start_codon:yes stop_codon:yes gene_type:complete
MYKFSETQRKAIKAAIITKDLDKNSKKILIEMLGDDNFEESKEVELYVDGAADLHSKTAGIGGVIYLEGVEISSFSEPLIEKTNNEAEYLALIKGIKVLHEIKILKAIIYSDSELIVKQVLGEYQIKNLRMKKLHARVLSQLDNLDNWSINHVKREKNVRADELSKIGLKIAKDSK